MAGVKKTFVVLLGVCIFCNVTAFENISFKYLDFKGLIRGIIASCNFDDTVYKYSGVYFISYYNLENQNEKLKNFGVNVNKVSAVVGITYNLDCNNAKELIQNISSFELFNNKNWLFISKNLTTTKEFIKHLDIHLSSDVSVAIVALNGSYQLYEAYKIEETLIFNEIEDGLKPNGTFKRPTRIMRRRNFQGIKLKGAITLPTVNNSYKAIVSYLESKGNVYSDTMQRKNYKIACVLADILNFRIEIVKSNEWGTYKNNKWTGAIGLSLEKKTNFTITTVGISRQRSEAVGFLPPTHVGVLAFVFCHPRGLILRNVFLEPFQNAVWILIVLFMFIFTLLLRFIAGFEDKSTLESTTSNIAVVTIGVIVQQGTTSIFRLFASRILLTSILVLSFILYQFYSAYLVGSLLSEPPKRIDTPEKLLHSRLRLGMEKLVYNEKFLDTSSASSRKMLKKILKERNHNVLTIKEGLERVKNGEFAFHVDTFGAYRYLADTMSDKNFCKLQTIRVVPKVVSSIVLHKSSILKEYLMNGVLLMMERGVLDYQDKYWKPKTPNCRMIRITTDDIEVGLEPILLAFFILAAGMMLGSVILLVERLSSNYPKFFGVRKNRYISNRSSMNK